MSRIKVVNLRNIQTLNKGFWLGAKIYSDLKTTDCKCGGKFIGTQSIKKVSIPVCDSCGEYPSKFRIRAKVVDPHGDAKYITIRHSQNGQRLEDIIDCLGVLKRVDEEIEAGEFDIKKYDTKKMREEIIFENFAPKYLEHYKSKIGLPKDKGGISPGGFKAKSKYVEKLKPFFGKKELPRISYRVIEEFKDSFKKNFRTRDLAVGELKTMLRRAKKLGLIKTLPEFDPISAPAIREIDVDIRKAREIALGIDNIKMRTAIYCLTVYPVRPGELRAIKLHKDIDRMKKKIIIRNHFSAEVFVEGRKSLGKQKEKALTFPIVKELETYLDIMPYPMNPEAFLFPGETKEHLSDRALNRALEKELKKWKGVKPFSIYDLRHARITEIETILRNKEETIKYSGHTNTETLKRYDHSAPDYDPVFAEFTA